MRRLLSGLACTFFFAIASCSIPPPVESAQYLKDCSFSEATPPADQILVVTVRLPDCRNPPNLPMTFYRGSGAMYGAVDRQLRMTFHTQASWDRGLLDRLRQARTQSPVLFVHGYNNSSDDALLRAFAVADAVGWDFPIVAMTWPSYASKRRYFWDEANAEWSFGTTRAVIEDLASRNPRLVILAHSMGNRIVLDALHHYRVRTGTFLPLKGVIMASPDVDRQQVRETLIAGLGAPVTIYASTEDQPLSGSWRMHGLPRAGDLSSWVTGRVPYYAFSGISGLEVVNTAAVRRDRLGHSDFIETEQGAGDLCRVLREIATKGRRPVTGQAGYWELTKGQPADWCSQSSAFAVRTLLRR